MALSEASIEGATMAASTANRQRGGGFAERLAALRQDTLVEIDMRELRCPLDRSGPGDAATTTRDQASSPRQTRGIPEPPPNPVRFRAAPMSCVDFGHSSNTKL